MSFRQKEIDQRMEQIARRRQYQNQHYSNPEYDEQYYNDEYENQQLSQMHGGKFNIGNVAKGIGRSKIISTGLALSGHPGAAYVANQFGAGIIGGRYNQSNMVGGKMAKLKYDSYGKMGYNPQEFGVYPKEKRELSPWNIFVRQNMQQFRTDAFLDLENTNGMYTAKDLQALTMARLGDAWSVNGNNPKRGEARNKKNGRGAELQRLVRDF